MCGIAGFLDRDGRLDPQRYRELALSMADALAHRGPDDRGAWVDGTAGIGLSNRRLAILDTRHISAQPMVSSCGRYVITYNGEIYNAPELRVELEASGRIFRGHSDTEVLLEGCAQWGLCEAITRADGMFALALWDRETRTLALVRDRIGIKPLYWAEIGGQILFGSELKALRRHPAWAAKISKPAVAAYLRHSYVPAPHSIYEGVRKLPPASILTVKEGALETKTYWDVRDTLRVVGAAPTVRNSQQRIDALCQLLKKGVRMQMRSDVPVGVLLSGGVDSTVIAALAREHAAGTLKTFSLGFREADYDETPYAEAIAASLGTDHTSYYATNEQVMETVQRLPEIYDEPFSDSSQIPTTILSRLIRKHVTVALSGDGGDELFAGYDRYFATGLNALMQGLPASARRFLAAALLGIPAERWNALANLMPASLRPRSPGARAHFLASMMKDDSTASYRALVSHWHSAQELLPGVEEATDPAWSDDLRTLTHDRVQMMQVTDLLTYLPDDLLVKMDRASMAASLEVRVPFLSHDVVEQALSLPLSARYRDGRGKWLLRKLAYRFVPHALLDRPKRGFACPLHVWLRGPLREWAEELLSEDSLRQDGLLNPTPIREKWQQHIKEEGDWHNLLWVVLQLLQWRRSQSV